MDKTVIYWAAPCFTQAERIWNRLCAEYLRKKGHEVILPQDEANKFLGGDKQDFKGLAESCYSQAIGCDAMVDILDGPDPDSGMSMEAGFKIRDIKTGGRGVTVGVRTDFRVSEDGQLNAMFRLLDDIVFFPSFNESCQELCDQIDEKIQTLLKSKEH
ncbi:MAG: hypothetical protein COV69_03015 [Parcubacteria group bacterium CG11_big_fil_rev_8_21_14_0_20_39_14]|nr:MAG: hypothetical protein COV69_03015 [Parcubacteria group bacterium CG11_big_fil_rev_8_21_14_0_20_39_14]